MNCDIISVSGVAQSGKDTLVKCLTYLLKDTISVERFGFADELKLDMNDFLLRKVGISAFTIDPEEKKIIRDLLVSYGKCKRLQTRGTYWTKILEPKVLRSHAEDSLPCISDCRFDEYEQDEVYWVKEKMKGCLIHVTRFDSNGLEVEPANETEAENDPKVRKKADFRLNWPTLNAFNLQCEFVERQLMDFLDLVKIKYGNRRTINR